MPKDEVDHLCQVVALLCEALKRMETAVTSGDKATLIHHTKQCAQLRRNAQDVILDKLCQKWRSRNDFDT